MASHVEGYLAELRTRLAGSDPALVQDALYDAEEYLRSAVAETDGTDEAFTSVVEAYGTPEEIAGAYRDAETTIARTLRKPAASIAASPLGFFKVVTDPTAWGAMFYMLLALVTGITYFTVVVTGLSLTAGLAVLIVGIPFALLFLAVVRAVSLAEGRIVEGLLGVRMPRRPRTIGSTGTLLERIKDWLTDVRTWTTMLYMGLQLPLGITYFTIVVTGLSIAVGLIALPFLQLTSVPTMIWDGYAHELQYWAMPFVAALGVMVFVATLWVAKGLGHVHGLYAKAILVGGTEPTIGVQMVTAPAPVATKEA